MKTFPISKYLLAVCGLMFSSAMLADDNNVEFDFNANVAYLSDSNVGIADLDTNTGTGDSARTYSLGLKSTVPVSERIVSRFGYDYSDTAYQELGQFDLGLHHAFAELALKFHALDAGLSIEKFSAELDGDDYLDLVQVSPNVSRLIGKSVFLRGAYTQSKKSYASLPGRNATNGSLRGDFYMLIDRMDRYIALGVQSGDEDAVDSAFDYRSLRWSMTYSQTLAMSARKLKLKAQMSHEGRTYAMEEEAIGDRRRDSRLRLRLGADWKVFEHFSIVAHAEHTNVGSNLETARLGKTVLGIGVNTQF